MLFSKNYKMSHFKQNYIYREHSNVKEREREREKSKPVEQFHGGLGLSSLAHCLEHEIERRRIRLDRVVFHLSHHIQQLSGGGSNHQIGPQVIVEQAHIGLVWLPVLVQRLDPSLEQPLHFRPVLRRRTVGEDVHEALGVHGARGRRLAEKVERNHGLIRGRIGDRAAPILIVEGASRGRVWRERRGGIVPWLGELRLLRKRREGGDGSEAGVLIQRSD